MPEVVAGVNRTYLFLKAPNASTPNQVVDWTTPAILMPSDRSAHNFEDAGDFNASLALWYDLYFQAYIRIGDFYYNGTNWEYVASGQTPPKCDVTLWSDTCETTSVTNIGQRIIETKSYYYTISNPIEVQISSTATQTRQNCSQTLQARASTANRSTANLRCRY